MEKKNLISFSDLYTMDFDITDIFAMRQKWYRGLTFTMDRPRKSTGIIYLNGCVGEYTSAYSEAVCAPCKSLVCLPAQSEYKVLNADCGLGYPDAFLVEFNIVKDGEILTFADAPYVVEGVNACMAAELVKDVVAAYEASIRSSVELKATVYRLLAFLGKQMRRSFNKKFLSIEAGIELLESDPTANRSIEEITEICGVSSACFRRLFREYSGKSPSQYRIEIRLEKAKNMLLNSDITIENIADSLGFESSAYFCRQFKKKEGMTPKEYKKKNI